MSKGAGEADVKLLFGADEASFGRLKSDIESMLSRLDESGLKVKIGANLKEAENDVNNFADKVRKAMQSIGMTGATQSTPFFKIDTSATKQVASDMSKIATEGAKAASSVMKMSASLSAKNQGFITKALNQDGVELAAKDVSTIVSMLKEVNVELTEAHAKTSQIVGKEQVLESLKLSGRDADKNAVQYLVQFDKKTGEIKSIINDITVKSAKSADNIKRMADEAQRVTSGTNTKQPSYSSFVNEYTKALSLINKNGDLSGTKVYGDLSAQLSGARTIIDQVKEKWDELSESQRASTSMSKIFGDVLSSSSYNAKESIDAIKSSVANLKVEIESVGVTGKGLGLNDVMNNARKLTSSNTVYSEDANYQTIINLLSKYDQAVKSAKDGTVSFAEALSQAGISGQQMAEKTAAAMEKLSNKIKLDKSKIAVEKSYSSTLKTLEDSLSKWTRAKNSINSESSDAYAEMESAVENLKAARNAYDGSASGVSNLENAVRSASATYSKSSQIIKANGDATATWGEKVGSLAKKFGNWFSASQMVLKAVETVKKMVSAVIELDTAMTELKKVTDGTDATYAAFLDRAVGRTQQLGASLSDTVSATADFARLGYSIKDAEKLADSAVIYKNVGDGISDISEASESIISTMQAFGVSAQDAMTIVDKFNAVGNNYAISSKGVGDALLRSASAMKAAGNTLDETIALATAANTVIQDPDKVGTSLKTISMFLRAAKTEVEDAGESTDGMATSVSKLRKEILLLTDNKVDIQVDEDTFKSTTQILRELSEVWDELTDVTKANILERIGGKRNANVTSALIENFKIVDDVIKTSSESAGSALAENEKVLQSIQGRINVFKAAFESLSQSIFKSDLIGWVVTMGTKLINLADGVIKFTDSIGGLKTVLIALIGLNIKGMFGEALTIINKIKGSSFISSLLSSLSAFKSGFSATMSSFASEMEYMLPTNKIKVFGSALKSGIAGVAKEVGTLNFAVGAATTAVTVAYAIYSKWKSKQEEIRQEAIKSAEAYRDQESELRNTKKTIEDISDRYETLSKGVDAFGKNRNLSTSEYEEYKDIVDQISSKFPEMIKGYNDEGIAILSCAGSVNELAKAYDNLVVSASNEILDKAPTLFKEFEKQRNKYDPKTVSSSTWGSNFNASDGMTMKSINALKSIMNSEDIENAIIEYANRNSENSQRILYALYDKGVSRNTVESDNEFILRAIKENRDTVNSIVSEFESDVSSACKDLQSVASAYISKALTTSFSGMPDELQTILKQIPNAFDFSLIASFDGNEDEFYKYLDGIISDFNSLNESDQNAIKVAFDLQTMLNNGECSVGEYLARVNEISNVLGQFDEKTQKALKILFNIDEDGIKEQYDKVLESLGEENKKWVNKLSADELEILFNISVKEDTDGWTLEQWKTKLGEYKAQIAQDATDIESATKDIQNAIDGINKIQSVINEQKSGVSLNIETLNSDEIKDYKSALEMVNGAVQLNIDKVDEIVRKKADEQIAIINTNKALEQSKYIENARKIEEYRKKLKESRYEEGETRDSIKLNISSLLEENSAIADTCDQYEMLALALRDTTSAYQHWLNSQNSSDYGDLADSTLGAVKQINDTYNPDSDIYGNFGSKKFTAAVDLIIPDSVDSEDLSAIQSYMTDFKQYLSFDKDGNVDGLNIDQFLSNAVKVGLVNYEKDTGFTVAGEKSMEDFAKGLNMSEDMVRAFFDELQLKGAEFDWSDGILDGERTLGDLAVQANESAEALKELKKNKDLDIKIDVSDLETTDEQIAALDTTIAEMGKIKGRVNVSSKDVERANDVIAYCLTQKQLLSQPDVMRVDTSKVEGDYGEALSLLQQFQKANDDLEIELAVGADTTETQKQIKELQSKIQGLSPEVKAKLGIDSNSVDSIKETIRNITAETLVTKVGVDASVIEGYNPESKTCDVIYDPNTDLLPKSFGDMHCNVIYDAVTDDLPDKFSTLTRWVEYKAYGDTEGGGHSVNGTAHADGTARVGGDWGTAPGGETLVGELGREIVVDPRTGRWYTVGDRGAEFVTIPKGAIVFNHVQTESLLENGFVTGRGTALMSGTAYGGGVRFTYKPYQSSNTGSAKSTQKTYANKTSTSTKSQSNTAEKNATSDFEKELKRRQHLLEMDKISQKEYLDWLDNAYKNAYKNREIGLDDYRKYKEEVYKGLKSLTEDSFKEELNLQKHKVAMGKKTEQAYYNWLSSCIKSAYKQGAITIDEYRGFLEEIKNFNDEQNKASFQSQVDDHEYRLNMDLESEEEYYKWLKENNSAAYKNGQIDKSQYRANKEAIFQASRDQFVDKIEDRNFQIDQLVREGGKDAEIFSLRQNNIEDIEKRIAKAKKYGLDENDEWVQRLISMLNDEKDAAAESQRSLFEKEIKQHEHMVAMGEETDEEYFEWFKARNEEVFSAGIINQDEYWSNLESLQSKEQDIFSDKINDRNFSISQLEREGGKESEIIDIYNQNITDIENAISAAKARGLDESSDWIQQLTSMLNEAKDGLNQTLRSLYDQEIAEHHHSVAMGKETDAEYYEWFKKRNEEAYAAGVINQEEYWQNLESLYSQGQELFKDSLNDKESKISNLEAEGANAKEIVSIYESAIEDIKLEIDKAYAYGLDENDEYVQYLTGKLNDYQKNVKSTTDEITNNAKDAMDTLVSYQENIIKQDLNNQKEVLQKRLSETKKYYDKRKEYLQDQYDQDTYLKDQKEKRKEVTDIEGRLKQLENDDSAWAAKRRLELESELQSAKQNLEEFERKKNLDTVIEAIDDLYEKEEELVQKQIDSIDAMLNNPQAIYNKALLMVKNNTDGIYAQMIEYNRKYGSGNDEDVKETYDKAKDALDKYESYYGSSYADSGYSDLAEIAGGVINAVREAFVKSNKGGYASGTPSANSGLYRVFEEGYEQIFTSKDGKHYRIMNQGDMVLDADKTRFLYNFAQSKGSIFKGLIRDLGKSHSNINNNNMQNIDISTGDIIIQGNADNDSVSKIRREQRSQVDFILREFKKLNNR